MCDGELLLQDMPGEVLFPGKVMASATGNETQNTDDR